MKDNAPARRFWFILSALAAVVTGCAALGAPPGEDAKEADRLEMVRKVVEAHNQVRGDAGLRSLEGNKRLTIAAQKHAEDMAEHETMSHTGSDGTTPFRRIEKAGYTYARAGENVARGQTSVGEVMRVWMDSETHRRNVLGKFSEIGVGHATGADGASYWCVTFGSPLR